MTDAPPAPPGPAPLRRVLILAASFGGPASLRAICAGIRIPPDCGGLILQHIEPAFAETLAEGLSRPGGPAVRVAADGDRIPPGGLLLAPGGSDLSFRTDGRVSLRPPAPGRPAPGIDLALSSAAERFGRRVVAALLSGMDVEDGLSGITAVREAGGTTLAEGEQTAKSFGMARAAAAAGQIDVVAPLADLPRRIAEALEGGRLGREER